VLPPPPISIPMRAPPALWGGCACPSPLSPHGRPYTGQHFFARRKAARRSHQLWVRGHRVRAEPARAGSVVFGARAGAGGVSPPKKKSQSLKACKKIHSTYSCRTTSRPAAATQLGLLVRSFIGTPRLDVKYCQQEGCEIWAAFGSKEDDVPVFCKEHKHEDHIDVKNKRCEHEGCDLHPTFGSKEDGNIRFCKKHKHGNHVDVQSKRCEHKGCETLPTYGNKEDNVRRFCITHKGAHHVNVVVNVCRHEGCEIRPSYGSKEDRVRIFCSAHKITGHVDLVSKRCLHDGCEIVPIYIRQHGRHSTLLQRTQATWQC
jgi:hypothetical protein